MQHLDVLNDDEKSVFRTAFEIDQRWVVELAADRAPLICQGQSLNLYLRSDIHKWDLHMLHWTAWERGVKSLYYCRSKSVQRAGFAGVEADNTRVMAQEAARRAAQADERNTTSACHVSERPQIELHRHVPACSTPSRSYKPFRYPWAIEYWRRQQQIHWMPEEIPLGEDCKDWSNRITDAERNLLTQIFRFFTQSDVEVQDNYMERYARVFRPTEIKMMLAAFANMETVHIAAYALLLETLGMPDSEFTAFMDYAAMRDKHDYLQGFGVETDADVLRTLAMFGGFTEGLQLFASFAILLNFPRHNKMRGMGQMVSWSVRDESLHCEGIIRLFHAFAQETGALTQSVQATTSSTARGRW